MTDGDVLQIGHVEPRVYPFVREARPCPLCGSAPAWHRSVSGAYEVHCTDTACRLHDEPREAPSLPAATEAWNSIGREGR